MNNNKPGTKTTSFGKTEAGAEVKEFTLTNAQGASISMLDWGATLRSVCMPDRAGKIAEICLGFDTLAGYRQCEYYFGATIGRFANRIAHGDFSINGKKYTLACNDGGRNHLHGGRLGYDKVLWQAEPFETAQGRGIRFSYLSRDGEEGYPGNLQVTVTYQLTDDNELLIDYQAETDQTTPVNLTNHAYWNLGGAGAGTIFAHELKLAAGHYLPVDNTLIPTGEMAPVKNTPMDFTRVKPLGRDFAQVPGGYDHCFVNDRPSALEPLSTPIAEIYEPVSGRGMQLYATQPGVQLYTSNFMEPTQGANGKIFEKYGAFCLETENFPDAVHKDNFPSPWLKPGGQYHEQAIHRFFVR